MDANRRGRIEKSRRVRKPIAAEGWIFAMHTNRQVVKPEISVIPAKN